MDKSGICTQFYEHDVSLNKSRLDVMQPHGIKIIERTMHML